MYRVQPLPTRTVTSFPFTTLCRAERWQYRREGGTRDSGLGTRNSGLGTRDSGLGTRDSGLGTRDSGLGKSVKRSGPQRTQTTQRESAKNIHVWMSVPPLRGLNRPTTARFRRSDQTPKAWIRHRNNAVG